MATQIIMPKLGLTMETGTLVAWCKNVGDVVVTGEAVCEIETDKITNVVESPCDGVLLKQAAAVGEEVPVLKLIAVIGQAGEVIGGSAADVPAPVVDEKQEADSTKQNQDARAVPSADEGRVRASPRARKLMEEHGLAPEQFAGLGKGRVSEDDVLAFINGRGRQTEPAPLEQPALIPLTPIQKTAARRLTESFRDVPQFSVCFHIDASHLVNVKGEAVRRIGRKISLNDVLLRAVALAIRALPPIQRQYTDAGLVEPTHVNLGMAVASDAGLMVPVITDADRISLADLTLLTDQLAEKARTGRVTMDDMAGGTFTVSNLGMFGIDSFVPIVNPPQSAILGVGGMHDVVRMKAALVINVPTIDLTLSCDHRAVDGAVAARFCQVLQKIIETEPFASLAGEE